MRIVGIGASAGGLEAVTELLGALPAATGMAYIVVQHLDPRHESLLSETLAKKTAIPVSDRVDRGTDADETSLRHIFHRLRSVHGVDFTHYKRTTTWRRLERRMALRRIDGLDEYPQID